MGLYRGQRLLMNCECFIEPTGGAQSVAEVVVRLGVVGLQPDRVAESGNRAIDPPALQAGHAEVVVDRRMIRVQCQAAVKDGNRLLKIASRGKSQPEIPMCERVSRME